MALPHLVQVISVSISKPCKLVIVAGCFLPNNFLTKSIGTLPARGLRLYGIALSHGNTQSCVSVRELGDQRRRAIGVSLAFSCPRHLTSPPRSLRNHPMVQPPCEPNGSDVVNRPPADGSQELSERGYHRQERAFELPPRPEKRTSSATKRRCDPAC